MSLFMSDSLKEKIDVASLEKGTKDLKVDSLFCCLFSTEDRVYHTTLHKFARLKSGAAVTISADLDDQSMLQDLLNPGKVAKVTVCVPGNPEDFLVYQTQKNFNMNVEKIERESLSGYNYLITIFISKA